MRDIKSAIQRVSYLFVVLYICISVGMFLFGLYYGAYEALGLIS